MDDLAVCELAITKQLRFAISRRNDFWNDPCIPVPPDRRVPCVSLVYPALFSRYPRPPDAGSGAAGPTTSPVYADPGYPQPAPMVAPGSPVYAPARSTFRPGLCAADGLWSADGVCAPASAPAPTGVSSAAGWAFASLAPGTPTPIPTSAKAAWPATCCFVSIPPDAGLSAGWLSTTSSSEYENAYSRTEVPFTLGARIHGQSGLAGLALSRVRGRRWLGSRLHPVVDDFGNFYEASDAGWFFDGQAGGGLELRLGRHVAITMDLRLATRLRIDRQPASRFRTSSAAASRSWGTSLAAKANFGLAFFFWGSGLEAV